MSDGTTRPTPDFFSFANQLVAEELRENSNDTLKQDLWEKMGNELEIAGFEKHKISQQIHHTVEEKLYQKLGYETSIRTAHFHRVMAKNNWQDPSFARHTKQEELDPSGDLPNSSIYTGNNAEIVNRLRLTKDVCNLAITKFKGCEDITSSYTHKEWTDFLKQWDAMLQINLDAFDEKSRVPQNTELLFLTYLVTEAGIINTAKKFMQKRIQLLSEVQKFLTRKQSTKYQKNDSTASKLPILQPHNRDMAIFMGYAGQECNNCNSWKTTLKDKHTIQCIDCNGIAPFITITKCPGCRIPLYDDVLLKVIQNENTCPNTNCEYVMELPECIVLAATGTYMDYTITKIKCNHCKQEIDRLHPCLEVSQTKWINGYYTTESDSIYYCQNCSSKGVKILPLKYWDLH